MYENARIIYRETTSEKVARTPIARHAADLTDETPSCSAAVT